ncbi:MAG: magnesium transporter [Erysipelotrichaceae bacterium]
MDITKELLINWIEAKKVHQLREVFHEYNIVDLAEIVEQLNVEHTLFLFKILQHDVSGELFSYLSSDVQESLITLFTGPQIKEILDNLYSDDILEFIEEMPANIVRFILSHATLEQRSEINKLLSYPDNSAGSIMSTDYISFESEDDVAMAQLKLRQQVKNAETISICFVEDHFSRLVGTIELYDLIFEKPSEKIVDIMHSDVIKVNTFDDQEEVAKKFEKYDLNAIPVVNEKNNLVGVITIDDIIDVIHEEVTEDMQKMAAITPTDESYLDTSIAKMSRSRIVWLLILMISATFTGNIMASYQTTLDVLPTLSIFIPMLMSTAGNAGSQAATMIIRALAIGDVEPKDLLRIWRKEFFVALVCGAVVGLVNFLRILVFMRNVDVMTSFVVSLTVIITLMTSTIIASTLPIVAVKIKQDPAVMAAPLITTIVDAVVLYIYFFLVHLFLL